MHHAAEVEAWAATPERRDRVEWCYTPTKGSWLNLAESFFRILDRHVYVGTDYHTMQELEAALEAGLAECADAGFRPPVGGYFAAQRAVRLPGASVIPLHSRRFHLGHPVWLRCTNARSALRPILAIRDARTAACFAIASDPAPGARIVTNRSLSRICSNQPAPSPESHRQPRPQHRLSG
jgi:hypothetical protein